jgi:hypothetical protein
MTESETREMLKNFADAITTGAKLVAEPLTRINANLQRIERHVNLAAEARLAQTKELARLNVTMETMRELLQRFATPRLITPDERPRT